MSDAIARFAVEADWDAECPLSDAARRIGFATIRGCGAPHSQSA